MSATRFLQLDLRETSDPIGSFTDAWPSLVGELFRTIDDMRWLQELQLCAMEAVVNAVRHGSAERCEPPQVRLEIQRSDDGWAELRVYDRGPGVADFASRTAMPDDLLAGGGRGIPLMHQYMEEAWYHVSKPENCLTLRRRMPAPGHE